MSSIDDFKEWLNSKEPKIVRSLILDAYCSDRKFLRQFEKVVDSSMSSKAGKAWSALLSAKTDLVYQQNASLLLESDLWDPASKSTLVGILNIVAYFSNLRWNSNLDSHTGNQDSTTTTTQKAYLAQRKQLEPENQQKQREQLIQEVDNYLYQSKRPSNGQSIKPSSEGNLYSKRKVSSTHALNPLIPFSAIALFGLGGIIVSNFRKTIPSTVQEEKASKTPSTDQVSYLELKQARSLHEKAVLVCEHNRVITTLNSIKRRTTSLHTKTMVDSLIADSEKQINFLNQDGKFGSYWEDENCRYGFQWFDSGNQDSLKAFMAVSAKCTKPSMTFDVRNDDNERLPIIGSETIPLRYLIGSHGEVIVPTTRFTGTYFPGHFTCG